MSAPITTPNEQGPKLTKATPISLREAGVTESWLENEIEKDPTILRLGDVTIIERQRRQEKVTANFARRKGELDGARADAIVKALTEALPK